MKVTLIHCYSDFNKGDLGIILSTIDAVKGVYPDAEINAVSTYNYNDSQYKTDHNILKKYVDNLYPSIFGLLFLKISGKEMKSGLFKTIKFFLESIRVLPLLFLPKNKFLIRFLLNKHEQSSFKILQESDIIISKGGSFICNEDILRSKIAYMRLMYIFLLLKKYDMPYYIFGQSLGPVYGERCLRVLDDVLKGSQKTYLREDECLKAYPYINRAHCSDIIVNDTAFTMKRFEEISTINFDGEMNIGFTIKHLHAVHGIYKQMIMGAMQYLIDKYNAKIYIFPQVTVDSDMDYARDIYKDLAEKYKQSIFILTDNFTPYQLRYGYSKMKFLIGTRLHSTIFTMSSGVPAINIAYHGTKSQGIYKNMGIEDLVIERENFNTDYLLSLIEKVINNYEFYQKIIKANLVNTERVMKEEIKKMIH